MAKIIQLKKIFKIKKPKSNKISIKIQYALLGIAGCIFIVLFSPGPLEQDIKIEVQKGLGSNAIAQHIAKQNAVYPFFYSPFKYFFRIYSSLGNPVIPGEFQLKAHSSIFSIVRTVLNQSKLFYYR